MATRPSPRNAAAASRRRPREEVERDDDDDSDDNGAQESPHKKPRRKPEPPQNDNDWNAMFVRLAVWKDEHAGDTMIDDADADQELAVWAKNQRSKALSTHRLAALNGLGFCWDLQKERDERRWQQRYEQLKQYKAVHGDCKVPTKNFELADAELACWVKTQRSAYAHKHHTDRRSLDRTIKHKKEVPTISDEHEAALNAIGFCWNAQPNRVGWDVRVNELVQYKERFGHTKVPQLWPENKSLGKWVAKCRAAYNLLQQGKSCGQTLTTERIAELNQLNFDWGKSRPKARKENKQQQQHTPDI